MTAETDLLHCPFCGEPAEIDTMQAFRALVGGDVQKCVAIYCTVCTVQVQHCYKDHPGEDRDALRDDLIAAWNRRACVSSATEALRAERDLFRAETIALAKDTDALRAEVDRWKIAGREWLDKTEWVQQTIKPRELGRHRADILRERIHRSEARAERLAEALRAFPAEPNPYTYRIAHAKARAALDQETTNG